MMKKVLSATTGLLLALSLCLTALSGILWVLGTTPDIMLPMMRRFAPGETTGLPDEEYPEMVHMITRYLAGDVKEFQHRYIADGELIEAFQPHEQQHMADCLALFQLDWRVLVAAGLLSLWLLLIVLLWWKERQVWRWCVTGLGALIAAVALVAVAAMADFNRLFILFHELSFSNDLWLLDPRTDLLIRLMPTNFFTTYAAILGVSWLALMGLMLAAALMLSKKGAKA